MTKGITGWIRTHNPLAHTKSETAIDGRAVKKREDTKRTSTTSQLRSLVKRSVSTAKPKLARTPKKPPEHPSKNTQPQRMTRYGFSDVEDTYLMMKKTRAELLDIGEGFDDDPAAAIQELLDVTSRPDDTSP